MPASRKSLRLARVLKDPMAWAYVVALWLYAVRENLGDDLSQLDVGEIAQAAGWEADPVVFVRSLVEVGWIDEPAPGQYVLHEFDLYNTRFVEAQRSQREAARERMRRLRANARQDQEASGTPGGAGETLLAAGTPAKGGTPPQAGTPAADDDDAGGTLLAGDAPPKAGTPVEVGTPATCFNVGECSGERSAERSRTRARAPASSRSVAFRFVDGGSGEGPPADAADLADFERFWSTYPRRRHRARTLEAWQATRDVRPPIGELLADVERRLRSAEWSRDGGRWRPGSDRYLADRRWEDTLEPSADAPPPRSVGAPLERDLDVAGRLDRLAAALPDTIDPELRRRIAACRGSAEEVESQLQALDVELSVAVERTLAPEQLEQLRAAVARQEGRLGHLTPGRRSDALVRLRRAWVRQLVGLPLLSLFSREAQVA